MRYAALDFFGLGFFVKQRSNIRYGMMVDFSRISGRAFITRDGEAIAGDALDDVHVLGVVTFTIIDVREDRSPV
ncbi:hypothetical protein [Raoultella lignicola]|uniref:Uncharacterized protein n=1 Tax=Raoultella lignicola TaxID=3040939 RepID=A0ABU9F307_9ENTR